MGRPARFFLGKRSHRTDRVTRRARAARIRDDRGLSIIEVVIAFSILLIVLVPIALLLSNTIGQAASSRERLTALSLAEQYLDLLNNTPVDSATATANHALKTTNNATLPKTNDTIELASSVVLSTVRYSVYAEFKWALHENSTPDLCDQKTAPTLLRLQVTVDWGHTPQKITDTTLINFPSTGIVTEGFLAIKVDGDPVTSPPSDAHTPHRTWTTRVRAVPVTIAAEPTTTGFTTITRYPTQYGCVFQEVPVGSFAVSVADPSAGTPPGTSYGTPSWASSDDELTTVTSPSARVTVDTVTTVAFVYDEGSMVNVTYPTSSVAEGPVTCPGAGSIECMVAGQSPTTATKPSSNPRADLTVLTSSGWTLYQPTATRLTASACAGSTRCISVGYLNTGGTYKGASVSTTPATVKFTGDKVPAGVTALTGITCVTTTCFAYGEGSSTSKAAIVSATVGAGAITWKLDTGLTGVSTVRSLSCSSTTKCYAAASTSSGADILSLTGTKWVQDKLPTTPTTVTAVSQVTCGTTSCFTLASSASKALILSPKKTSATTWVEDTVPAMASFSAIDCPSSTECFAAGKASASEAGVVSLSTVTLTPAKWSADSLTSAVTSLAILTCPSTTTCYATGSTSSGPAIVSLYKSTSTWAVDKLPLTLKAITALTCPSTAQCMAAAVNDTGTTLILSLSSTHPTTWTSDSLPSGVTPVFLAGLACSPAKSTCAAPAVTATGEAFLSATLSGTTWKRGSPGALNGMYLGDVPISVYNADLSPTTVEVASPTPTSGDVSTIGPLFPFESGYQVAAAGCEAEVTGTAPKVTSVPGATATSAPTAPVPMGLLPIEVESKTGVPVSGASVTIKPDCTRLSPPAHETNQASFSLGTTGPTGVTEMAVMYGSYTVTVKSGTTTTTAVVTVSPASLTVGAATVYLPTVAVVKL